MTDRLHIGKGFSLPPDAVTETFAILAKRGSGKTYLALVLVEELVGAGLPVVVVDPVGVAWGLRSSADGKGPGLPITILGGEHGDLPLEEGAGAVIADFVVEARQPLVLDLSNFRKGAQTRFMTDFAERLYVAKGKHRDPLHLVVDEADAFAPQRTIDPGDARLLGAFEDLVRRGRSRGIGITLVTQRPAVLNKNVLTQAEVLVVLRMTSPQDRKAIDDWVRSNGEEDKREELLAAMSSLPVGEAYFWSPGWLKTFKRVTVRKRWTFDSSSTPKAGARTAIPQELAKVDLASLRERVEAAAVHHKDNDPKALKKRVAELEQLLAAKAPAAPVERVEVPVLTQEHIDAVERAATSARDAARELGLAAESIRAAVAMGGPPRARTNGAAPGHLPRAIAAPIEQATRPAQPARQPGGAERKILQVLAQFPAGRTKVQIALLAGYAHTGGGFRNALSALRTRGAIEGLDDIRITPAGMKEAGPVTPLPRGRELVRHWLAHPKLGRAERAILTVVTSDPREWTKEEIAERAGYDAAGGGFRNALSKLRTLELVKGMRTMRANDTLLGAQ